MIYFLTLKITLFIFKDTSKNNAQVSIDKYSQLSQLEPYHPNALGEDH